MFDHSVELDYRNWHPDWASRAQSAFDQVHPLWCRLGVQLWMPGAWVVPNILTSNACDLGEYRNYLNGNNRASSRAFQLWTRRDLTGQEGCAAVDTIRNPPATNYWASAIVEGTEHPSDAYDANSAFQRGIVSAHEFTHIFGEENHPNGCRSFILNVQCNLMMQHIPISWRAFYWEDHTFCEVQWRFWSDAECP